MEAGKQAGYAYGNWLRRGSSDRDRMVCAHKYGNYNPRFFVLPVYYLREQRCSSNVYTAWDPAQHLPVPERGAGDEARENSLVRGKKMPGIKRNGYMVCGM